MLKSIMKLLRVKQWYKNLLVFLPLFFAGNLLEVNLIPYIIGFFSLSFMSSSYYILNDLKDLGQDKLHPEKRLRPLAKGDISKTTAKILFALLFSFSIILAIPLGLPFLDLVLLLFLVTMLYIHVLKKIAFIDIITISINFLIRLIAGAYIMATSFQPVIELSPWLILCVFFLALFLTSSKRYADIVFLKKKATKTRESLKDYDEKTTFFITIVSITMLLTVYSLYIVFVQSTLFLLTLPIAFYAVIRYVNLLHHGSIITRHPELFYKDKYLLASIILYGLVTFSLIYF